MWYSTASSMGLPMWVNASPEEASVYDISSSTVRLRWDRCTGSFHMSRKTGWLP